MIINLRGESVDVDVKVHYKGSPGKLYGRPEDCFPPEDPEFDVVSAMWEGIDIMKHPDLFEELIGEIYDLVMEEIRP